MRLFFAMLKFCNILLYTETDLQCSCLPRSVNTGVFFLSKGPTLQRQLHYLCSPLISFRKGQKPNAEALHCLFLTFPSNLAVAPSCTRIFRGGRVNAGASAGTGGLSVREVLETRVDVTSFTSPMMWTAKEKQVVI